MKLLYIIIRRIDYGVLIARIADKKTIPKSQLVMLGIELLNRLNLKSGYAKNLSDFAQMYGIYLDAYIKKNKNDVVRVSGGSKMLKIVASISNIDYAKAVKAIKDMPVPADKSPEQVALVAKVISIVEPFIVDTLNTIPPSAIAELFTLLGREKVIELAKNIGVDLADLSITAD